MEGKMADEKTVSPILAYFRWDHLPPALRGVSRPFADLASEIERVLPGGPEKSVALRKLLEAKDAAVRAALSLSESQRLSPSLPSRMVGAVRFLTERLGNGSIDQEGRDIVTGILDGTLDENGNVRPA